MLLLTAAPISSVRGADDDDFSAPVPASRPGVWDDEESDDDVKDDWDADSDEEAEKKATAEAAAKAAAAPQAAPKNSKKNKLADTIARKEAKEALESGQGRGGGGDIDREELARRQSAADLEAASDLFGLDEDLAVGSAVAEKERTLATLTPKTEEEFDEFRVMLVQKLGMCRDSPHYLEFLKATMRSICSDIGTDQVKEIHTAVGVVHSNKLKDSRIKNKKKGKSQKNKLGGNNRALSKGAGAAKDREYGASYDKYADFSEKYEDGF